MGRVGSHFFVIVDGRHSDARVLRQSVVAALHDGLDGCVGADLVVEPRAKDELVVDAAKSGWLNIDNAELNVDDFFALAFELLANQVNELRVMLLVLKPE